MQTTFYFIRSDSRKNVFYRVSETRGIYTCECCDFTYRQRECRHIEQVKRGCGIEAQPKRRVTVRPARPSSDRARMALSARLGIG